MSEVPAFQAVLEIVSEHDAGPEELDATAEAVLERLERHASFVAMGPVVSADYARHVVEVECTVCGESAEDVHRKIGRIMHVMLDAANSFEYRGTTTRKLEAVPA